MCIRPIEAALRHSTLGFDLARQLVADVPMPTLDLAPVTWIDLDEDGEARVQRAGPLVTLRAPFALKVIAQQQRLLQADFGQFHPRVLNQSHSVARAPEFAGGSGRATCASHSTPPVL
jgi:hypothetical protein